MADQDKDRQLDDLLNSLLSQYASAEPRPGLETRVVARIAESRGDHEAGVTKWRWLAAGGALFASAIALVVVLIVFRSERPHSMPQTVDSGHTQQLPVAPKSALESSSVATKRPGHKQKRTLMQSARQDAALAERPAVFPTPVPLSQQERLMFTYMANTPRAEVVSQITKDDQKEAAAFWAQGEPMPGRQRPALTR